MKKLIILMTVGLSLAACAGDKYYSIFLHSYITTYVDGSIEVGAYVDIDRSYIEIHVDKDTTHSYRSPETGGTGEEAAEFLRIAQRNGDRTYDQEEQWGFELVGRECWVDNFKSVEVVCMNAAWNDTHPAGASLNDLLRIKYTSYAHYIRSGYTDFGEDYWTSKPLTELKETDLAMIYTYFNLFFGALPQPGTYELQVTLTSTEGADKTAIFTIEIE